MNKSGVRPILVLLAGLSVIVLLLFAPSLRSSFAFDSVEQIWVGDFIHQPRNLLPVLTFQVMGMDVLDFNRPVALASLMFDSLVWARNPFGYHLTNILLHMIATGLAFLLIRRVLDAGKTTKKPSKTDQLSRQNFSAFLGALLFAVHPLVTEAVCEPSNRKDILATVFGLTALLVAARHSPSKRQIDLLRIVVVALLTLLAIGSKELGVVVPVLIFLYWALFRKKEPVKFWIATTLGSAFVVVIFLIARFSLAHQNSEVFLVPPVYPGGSLGAALLIQPRILTLYLANVVWPTDLCADYNLYSIRNFPLPLSLFVLIVVGAGLAAWSIRDRRTFFAVGIVVAALLPVCNLVPIYCAAADRFLYFPLIGVAMLVSIALDHPFLVRQPLRYRIAAIAILIVAVFLTQVTLQRERVWSSGLALWQSTLKTNPTSRFALTILPKCYLQIGHLQEAKAQYEASLNSPFGKDPWLWAGYAIVLNRLGDQQHAAMAANRAVTLKPDIIETDKMVRTLQHDREFDEEFARLFASIRKTSSPNRHGATQER